MIGKEMMGKYLVSVVIPVFNTEEYLEECIESVRKQTYEKLEIILVDDGSTDRSGDICDSYAKIDERIKVFHKENEGLCVARNYGIEQISGDLLTFLDSDDMMAPDMIQHLLHMKDKYDCPIVGVSYTRDLDKLGISNELPDECMSTDEALKIMFTGKKLLSPAVWGRLYERRLFSNVRFPVGYIYEDVLVTYKLLLLCQNIVISHSELYFYRLNPNSITNTRISKKNLDLFQIADMIEDDIILHHKEYLTLVRNFREADAVWFYFKAVWDTCSDEEIMLPLIHEVRRGYKDYLFSSWGIKGRLLGACICLSPKLTIKLLQWVKPLLSKYFN